MPSSTEKPNIKSQFYDITHLPGVLGLVDGTHIRIQKSSENEADYVNRNFYHSINVQALCLPDGQFGDVMARFPGSVHVFGNYHRLEFMLKIIYWSESIYWAAVGICLNNVF